MLLESLLMITYFRLGKWSDRSAYMGRVVFIVIIYAF